MPVSIARAKNPDDDVVVQKKSGETKTVEFQSIVSDAFKSTFGVYEGIDVVKCLFNWKDDEGGGRGGVSGEANPKTIHDRIKELEDRVAFLERELDKGGGAAGDDEAEEAPGATPDPEGDLPF